MKMSKTSESFSSPFTRRKVLQATGAATLSLGIGLPASAQSKSLVSTVFGGVWEREYRKNVVEPFEKATGNKVLLKLGSTSEWLTNALVNRRRPEIDLLMLPYPDNVKAVMENLAVPLTEADIPNMKEVDQIWYSQFKNMGVGLDYVGYGIAYRTDLVPKPPTSWKDLWNPAYKGRVTVPDIGSWGSWEMLVVAARLNGGGEDNMAPAFPAMRALKGSVRQFFKGGPDITNLLGSGEAWVCGMTTNIPAYGLIDAGKPVKFIFPSEGAMVGLASYHIARNAPNAELCKQFVNFALSRSTQEAFCNGVIAGPVNRTAVVSAKVGERVPRVNQLQLFDWFKVVPQMQTLTDRWNQEVAF
jgi:putative spermidine/putrescine transport system substrate-binding protein